MASEGVILAPEDVCPVEPDGHWCNTMKSQKKKRTEFLPFCRPSIPDEDLQAVTEVLRSGWITSGPKAAQFEERFCAHVGCDDLPAEARRR